jgi:hypothetical protein
VPSAPIADTLGRAMDPPSLELMSLAKVREMPSRPKSWANFSLSSGVPARVRGPTCIFWASLTPLSRKGRLSRLGAMELTDEGGWSGEGLTHLGRRLVQVKHG